MNIERVLGCECWDDRATEVLAVVYYHVVLTKELGKEARFFSVIAGKDWF
jgi:hypothetical protein